jgi:hypothetical protein
VHVVLSLAGIGSGFIVVFGLIAAKRLDGFDRAVSREYGGDELDRVLVSFP